MNDQKEGASSLAIATDLVQMHQLIQIFEFKIYDTLKI